METTFLKSHWFRPRYALAGWLGLSRQEAGNLFGLGLLLAATMFGLTLGRVCRDVVLLDTLGKEWLPPLYIISTLFIITAALTYSHLVRKVHPRLLGPLMSWLMALLLVGCWLMLRLEVPYAAAPLYVAVQLVWMLSLMLFWNLATEIVEPQLAKRLFPMLSICALSAMMLAGSGALLLSQRMGASQLILIWCLLLAACSPLVRRLVLENHLGRKVIEKGTSSKGIVSEWRQSTYFKTFCISTLSMWFLVYLIDYIYNSGVSLTFQGKNEMAHFFGSFQLIFAACALAMHLFVTPRMLKHVGVASSTVFYPIILLVFVVLHLIVDSFETAVLLKFADCLFYYSIHDAVYQLLYNPITEQVRAVARSFIEGVLKPAAIAVTGISIAVLVQFGLASQLTWMALPAALAFAYFSHEQRRAYATALLNILHSGGRALRAQALEALRMTKDAGLYNKLLQAAKHDDVGRSLAALELYQQIGGSVKLAQLSPLLNHRSGEVTAKVLSWVSPELNQQGILKGYLRDQRSDTALQAVVECGKLAVLQSSDLYIFKDVLAPSKLGAEVWLQRKILAGAGVDSASLREFMTGSTPEVRGYLLERIGELGIAGADGLLRESLSSNEEAEFGGAVKLACRPGYESSIDTALELLHHPSRAQAAENILVAHGEVAYDKMRKGMDPTWPEHLMARWTRLEILAGKTLAREAVITSLPETCPRVKMYQARALVESEETSPFGGEDLEALGHILRRTELDCRRQWRQLEILKLEFSDNRLWDFLEDVMTRRFEDLRTTCLYLLGLVQRRGSDCLLLEPKLNQPQPKIRGHALETLENLAGRNEDLLKLRALYEHHCEVFAADVTLEKRMTDRILKNIYEKGLPYERWVVVQLAADRLGIPFDPMINLDHFFFLQSVSLFQELRREDLYLISELTQEATYAPGDEIFHEGDDGQSLFIIMAGQVDIVVSSSSGPKNIARLGEKQCFGEMALLDEEERSASVLAVTELRCLILEKTDFQHLMDKRPSLSREVIRSLVSRLRETNKS